MDLPAALHRWREALTLFPPEIAGALGSMIRRLDVAIGPLQVSAGSGTGEPDGLDGIDRRGKYEHLLLSEWLLAEEAPEEFARRASMGEHSFLRTARRDQTGARVSIALFDAGPGQWGAPRIAHLAALIVLARRAEMAGAAFHWGILQGPENGLRSDPMSPASVTGLLEGRDARDAPWAALTEGGEWRDLTSHIDDVWIISGPLRALEHTPRLEVADPLDPEDRRLDAAVYTPRRIVRRVSLPLPEERLCARLLRDPFSTAAAGHVRVEGAAAPGSTLFFSGNGSKLITRTPSGEVVFHPIPNSPRAGVGRPRVYRSRTGRPAVAAGRIGRSAVILTRSPEGDAFRLECVSGKLDLPQGDFLIVPDPDLTAAEIGLFPCLEMPGAGRFKSGVCFLLDGTLVRVAGSVDAADSGVEPAADVLATEVAAISPVAGSVAWVVRSSGGWVCDGWPLEPGEEGARYDEPGFSAFYGFGGGGVVVLGMERADGRWTLVDSGHETNVIPPPGTRVVGVSAKTLESGAGLVLLEADGRTLSVVAPRWSHCLLPAPDPITHVATDPFAPHVAYSTESGELTVYSLKFEAPVYQFSPEAPP